ncbi:hypothetical protein P4H39_19165, partial [Paenibacillus lautus]|uniref:hypothetical protein n=1 Tax=Paenibacillus lautus TaxID=1401 RepID=UPI002DB7CAFD
RPQKKANQKILANLIIRKAAKIATFYGTMFLSSDRNPINIFYLDYPLLSLINHVILVLLLFYQVHKGFIRLIQPHCQSPGGSMGGIRQPAA